MKQGKTYLRVFQSHSLRELVDQVNAYNSNTDIPITKEDIVGIFKLEDTFILPFFSE